MNLIFTLFEWNMTEPELYGWFHTLSLVLTVFLVFMLLKQKISEKRVRQILLVTSLLVIILEIYKQLYFCIEMYPSVTFHYNWNIFPWQFCSTPMYIGVMAAIVKNKKLHYRLCCYLCTYALMAGICVMLYPSSVFMENIMINIQTMVNHGTMVIVGVYLLLSGYVKCEIKSLIEALKIFMICIMIAIALNELAYFSGILEISSFNMFYISPYVKGNLPVYGKIQELVPYPINLMIYIVGFTLGSGLLLWLMKRKDEIYEYISCR